MSNKKCYPIVLQICHVQEPAYGIIMWITPGKTLDCNNSETAGFTALGVIFFGHRTFGLL